MPEIDKITRGPLARSAKLNEVIDFCNAIGFNLTVRPGIGDETPQLKVADNNAELIVSAGGGGDFELDVVRDNNTAGRAGFNGKGIL